MNVMNMGHLQRIDPLDIKHCGKHRATQTTYFGITVTAWQRKHGWQTMNGLRTRIG